jgi:hypothetical protein
MPKNWKKLVETAPTCSYQRMSKDKTTLLARYVLKKAFDKASPPALPLRIRQPESLQSSRRFCVYFGEGSETARAEFDSYYNKPLTEMGYYARVRLHAIIDLEDTKTLKHFGLKPTDFTRSYATKTDNLIPLQELSLTVSKQTKVCAIRFPSKAMKKEGKTGHNLVVFHDLVTGSDRLEIMEDAAVIESWPK